MTDFKDRERAEEAKFAMDEDTAFKVAARRNRLLGQWAAEKMGLNEEETMAYATAVVQADFDTECTPGQSEARWLMVTVAGTYEPMFPTHYFGDSDDKLYHMTATAGMRTS